MNVTLHKGNDKKEARAKQELTLKHRLIEANSSLHGNFNVQLVKIMDTFITSAGHQHFSVVNDHWHMQPLLIPFLLIIINAPTAKSHT
jgi:hypothetical protein